MVDLETNEVAFVEVESLTAPEGARHFNRRGAMGAEAFYTCAADGAAVIDADTLNVTTGVMVPGAVSRVALLGAH